MPENLENKRYSLEEAKKEAELMQEKIKSGKVQDYDNAEKQIVEDCFKKMIREQKYGSSLYNEEIWPKLLSKIHTSQHSILANKLLDNNVMLPLVRNIKYFSCLDNHIAQRLIEANESGAVAENLEKFPDLDHNKFAQRLIEAGDFVQVAENLEKFPDLDHNKFAQQMIDRKLGFIVDRNCIKFTNLSDQTALKLIEAGPSLDLAMCIDHFPNLDHKKIAQKMIKVGRGNQVSLCMDRFIGLDHNQIAQQLISVGMGHFLADDIEKFDNLNNQTILKLVEDGEARAVAENLNNFSGLDNQTAQKLIEAGEGWSVARYLNNFSGLDHNDIAQKLIEAGEGWSVARYLNNFSGLDHNDIAQKLIEAGEGGTVVDNLKKLSGLDNQTAQKLIEAGEASAVAENLNNFSGLDNQTAQKLIEAGEGRSVAAYLEKFFGIDHREIASKLAASKQQISLDEYEDNFDPSLVKEAADVNLLLSEYIILEDKLSAKETDYQANYELLKQKSSYWQDEENVTEPFKQAGEYFGYDKMFEYIGRDNRHDILYNFRKIVDLAQKSGLRPVQFYGQILSQVRLDEAQYGEEGREIKSYELLNNIVDAVEVEKMDEIMAKADHYKEIEKMQNLVKEFKDKENIFENWKNLKKYYELIQLLGKSEVLEKLKELKEQGKEELYKYVETLAFHPNIDMQKVIQFWQRPDDFLDIGEVHAPSAHEKKKPSNYVEMPHLDLSPEDLRDSLVEGDLDKLMDWQPLEIEYNLLEDLSVFESEAKDLKVELVRALGKRREGIEGEAQNPPKLFSELNKLFKSYNLKLMEYLQEDLELSEELEQKINDVVYDQEIGLKKAEVITGNKYRAKINLKSDPDGVVAGNDTACCMPFGSGKNNVYTFNPTCSLFTVQKRAGEKWRTIAQSVLTKDKDIKQNMAEIVKKMQQNQVKLSELVPEDVLLESENVIAADNIEVAPNFKSHPDKDKILQYIYTDFFKEYVTKFAQAEKIDKSQLIIGIGYTDALTGLDEIENTFVPEAPVGYSDNLGKEALKIDLQKDIKRLSQERRVSVQGKPERDDLTEIKAKGVSNLTFKDSLQVAYIEGKAYRENESLMEYLHNMENALIAKDINNIDKNRKNLSLKYTSDKGKMQGYILAYEGKYQGWQDQEASDVIYVADLAADPEAKLAGGRLLKAFVENYKLNYLDKKKFVPILAELREKTSYAIIIKQMDKIAKDLGIEFDIDEHGEEQRGEDVMHTVMIKPILK